MDGLEGAFEIAQMALDGVLAYDAIARAANPAPPNEPAPGPSHGPPPGYGDAIGSGVSGVGNMLPQSLSGYVPKRERSSPFYLGQHPRQPRFTLKIGKSWRSGPWMELHAGPNETYPIVATVENVSSSRWSDKDVVIRTIPHPGFAAGPSSSSSAQPQHQQQYWQLSPQEVHMHLNSDWVYRQHQFSAEVGRGNRVWREQFEWRPSGGGEVRQLDEFRHGWKLARVGSWARGPGGERATRSLGATSDGKEIVAVFSDSSDRSAHDGFKEIFKFQFLESGATGVLGDSFALIVLMSALKIWCLEYGTGTGAVVAGPAGGGA